VVTGARHCGWLNPIPKQLNSANNPTVCLIVNHIVLPSASNSVFPSDFDSKLLNNFALIAEDT
jgi:hypothetical protein